MQKLLISALLIVGLALGACTHRLEIPQGNIVTPEMVETLRPGMDERQVRFIMGSPLLTDPFRPDRWDYVSYVMQDGEIRNRTHVTLLFEQGRLARIDTREAPEAR